MCDDTFIRISFPWDCNFISLLGTSYDGLDIKISNFYFQILPESECLIEFFNTNARPRCEWASRFNDRNQNE
jgi:hypothetical protein